jgi:hypothetical protein
MEPDAFDCSLPARRRDRSRADPRLSGPRRLPSGRGDGPDPEVLDVPTDPPAV